MGKYLNHHDLYQLPCLINYNNNFRKNYINDDRINNCYNYYELQRERYIDENINNIMSFVNKNFNDLTNKEKNILCNNLLNAEQFTPAKRY